jgi:hypothetical protein
MGDHSFPWYSNYESRIYYFRTVQKSYASHWDWIVNQSAATIRGFLRSYRATRQWPGWNLSASHWRTQSEHFSARWPSAILKLCPSCSGCYASCRYDSTDRFYISCGSFRRIAHACLWNLSSGGYSDYQQTTDSNHSFLHCFHSAYLIALTRQSSGSAYCSYLRTEASHYGTNYKDSISHRTACSCEQTSFSLPLLAWRYSAVWKTQIALGFPARKNHPLALGPGYSLNLWIRS